MSERIYISGGTVEVDISALKIGLGIGFGFLCCLVLIAFIVSPTHERLEKLEETKNATYAPKRISVDGVDCVVINRTAISCDWNNAQPYTQKQVKNNGTK